MRTRSARIGSQRGAKGVLFTCAQIVRISPESQEEKCTTRLGTGRLDWD